MIASVNTVDPDLMDYFIGKVRTELRRDFGMHRVLVDEAPLGTLAAPRTLSGTNVSLFTDLTDLKPQSTAQDIKALCSIARQDGAASVCVNSLRVPVALEALAGSRVPVCAVVGFPLGASLPEVVRYEAQGAVHHGAREIDMVAPAGLLRDRNYHSYHGFIAGVVDSIRGTPVKVILETCKLTEAEIVAACLLSKIAGAAFVKTSTGFSLDKLESAASTGATVRHVQLMRRTVGDDMGVKASGGIASAEIAFAMLSAGASRLGASKAFWKPAPQREASPVY